MPEKKAFPCFCRSACREPERVFTTPVRVILSGDSLKRKRKWHHGVWKNSDISPRPGIRIVLRGYTTISTPLPDHGKSGRRP
jgi:hypothetical protein